MNFHEQLRLIFVRHGESFSNIAEHRRLNSLKEQITPEGTKQAEDFSKNIISLNINRIISSDEDRAFTTATIISKKLHIPIETSVLVREKSSGDFSGRTVASINWDAINSNPDFYNKKVPGGESVNDVIERVKKFMISMEDPSVTGTVLVVTHGSFMRILIGVVLGKDVKETLLNTKIKNLGYYSIVRNSSGIWNLEREEFL